ncbi:Hypothetical protein CpCP13_0725 [Corynebacterium pseudotuberculosis]|nr:Hypothetical protein CpPAT10_0708a [Corynebacterium pseudotuberculosis PAT10]AFF21864.1 Hypothetical protein CpP54B96_0721 [Corynebacterium pseudotuberculosis P54B96]AFH51645.1 Hypothetical protein Cp267_0743 [Corynebacterium pseudotuberculosis 267]AJC13447.1 Hypothetical protein CpVD57_0726 [Corynebacterium pseudotuberculosis]AKJ55386.1 Hypothetical protein Cp12C_0756 [Corynebacterium pseudotuberculosis]
MSSEHIRECVAAVVGKVSDAALALEPAVPAPVKVDA